VLTYTAVFAYMVPFMRVNSLLHLLTGNISDSLFWFFVTVISDYQVMGGFLYPSTQRHYRRVILLILLYCCMFRSYDHHHAENILLARITQLITDPFF
jgi:hypothetical protein